MTDKDYKWATGLYVCCISKTIHILIVLLGKVSWSLMSLFNFNIGMVGVRCFGEMAKGFGKCEKTKSIFNKKQQHAKCVSIRENLGEKELLINLDFSKNYSNNDQNEIRNAYFGTKSFSYYYYYYFYYYYYYYYYYLYFI